MSGPDKHPEITDEEQELITVEELSQKLVRLWCIL